MAASPARLIWLEIEEDLKSYPMNFARLAATFGISAERRDMPEGADARTGLATRVWSGPRGRDGGNHRSAGVVGRTDGNPSTGRSEGGSTDGGGPELPRAV
jgi:hypothetical protein